MAYHTDLTPGLAESVLDDPAGRDRVAAERHARRRRRRLDADDGRHDARTRSTSAPGSATPLYFPSIRPGSNPRADSLIAVNLATGRMKWWQQQMPFNEWSYDTAQPPLVYTAKVGGKKERIVSVATMEGVWFAYDAATGRPIYQRDQGDRSRPSTRRSSRASRSRSSRLRSAASTTRRPRSTRHTNYIFNAAAETAAVDVQAALTPTQKKRKFTLGDVFLGLAERQLRHGAARLARPRLDQRHRRHTRASASGSSRRRSRSAAGSRPPRAASASPAAATACCARST